MTPYQYKNYLRIIFWKTLVSMSERIEFSVANHPGKELLVLSKNI